MAKINAFTHDMETQITLGMRLAFLNPDVSLKKFDIVTANPMWNQKSFAQDTYEHDPYNRFNTGHSHSSSAD